MVEIKWTKKAFKDLEGIYSYVLNDSEVYASRLIEKLITAVDQLETFPYSGRTVPEKKDETIRELIEGNYRIFYKVVSSKQIVVLRIHHSARNIR